MKELYELASVRNKGNDRALTYPTILEDRLQALNYCVHYNLIVEKYNDLCSLTSSSIIDMSRAGRYNSSVVENAAIEAAMLKTDVELLPQVVHAVDPSIANHLTLHLTKGTSYEKLRDIYDLKCSEDYFWECVEKVLDEIVRKRNNHLV